MDQFYENLNVYLKHSISKNNILKNCNSESCKSEQENKDEKTNGFKMNLETKCTNWMFILLNSLYLITALFVLAAGIIGKYIYSSNIAPTFELNWVSFLWIFSGVALLFVSCFGIIGGYINSVAWINIYSILITMTFSIQLATSVIGLSLISQSEFIANSTLNSLITNEYGSVEPSSATIDFIQKSNQCCGVESANDWNKYWKYDYYNRTPQSCCTSGSRYTNLTCDSYFQKGCLVEMTALTLQVIVIIFLISLAITFVQFIGIKIAFEFAKMMRTIKSYEAEQQLRF